jgi:hypothetical protein
MIDIQPQYIPFGKLVSGRLFRIPQYQRAYSWRTNERMELFEDILRTWKAGAEGTHFLATIVGLRREKRKIITDEHQVLEVVDGQQRLTTLIILLKAIAKALDRSDTLGTRIGQELDDTLVKPDQASLLLLQTNHDSSGYFADYLRTGKTPSPESANTLADRELLLAMQECETFVARWATDTSSLSDLVTLLKNRLTCIFHEISDEAVVYTIFEVLNSRGLEVSWFDRTKSMLMAVVFETDMGNKREIIDEVHQLWTDIYRCVGIRLGMNSEALKFAATLRLTECPRRVLGEEDAAYLLRDQSKAGAANVIETTRWLLAVTKAVNELVADRRKDAVTGIIQARLLAAAVILRPDISKTDKGKVLRRWENVTFRIYGMSDRDSRTAVGDYVRLAWRITNEKMSADQILAEISALGKDYPVAAVVNGLRNEDCYTDWQDELRYFFYRYEEHLAQQSGQIFNNEQWNRIWEANSAQSIEHILPQSAGKPDLVHRIGNLLILPPRLNSKLGAKPPDQKADDYLKTGLLLAQEVVSKLPKWHLRQIEEREDALLKWALQEWTD